MRRVFRTALLVLLLVVSKVSVAAPGNPQHRTENIIFVMTDGLRWQEVLKGRKPA